MPQDLWQPDFDRLLDAIQCRQPDRVPFFELGVDQQVVEAVLHAPYPASGKTRDDGLRYRIEFLHLIG